MVRHMINTFPTICFKTTCYIISPFLRLSKGIL